MTETDETLLKQIRELDAHEAWQVFFRKYWAAILRYARKLGLKAHQAEEVLQETMVELMRILPEFDYDRRKGRFRNFLLTIVHRKSLRVMRRAKQTMTGVPPAITDAVPDGHDDGDMAEAEARWRESIRDILLERLRGSVDEHTFAVFDDYVLQGQPAESVARTHGLTLNAVYQIKNRLTRRLQKETEAWVRDSELG